MSSIIKVDTIQKADGTAGTIENLGLATGALSHRNLIINGDMRIAQRGTSTTGINNSAFYTVDRMKTTTSTVFGWTNTQSTDAPDGFSNSFKLECTTAVASPTGTEQTNVRTFIEGQDLQHLAYGTSSAKAMTLSFWVKSNKTGTATICIREPDNSNRQITPTYAISSADTWEYKTISIPGDTSSSIDNDNGQGLAIEWWLHSSSTYTGGTNQTTWTTYDATDRNATNIGIGSATSDYFAITGVQLEVGSVATPFEHRSYGEELARCQRYYQVPINNDWFLSPAMRAGTGWVFFQVPTAVTMRTEPSATITDTFGVASQGSSGTFSTITMYGFNDIGCNLIGTNSSISIPSDYTGYVWVDTTGKLEFDAEL